MASSRWFSRKMHPSVACSKPARMRSSVVLPEPLSPNSVRNSPWSTSSEMDSSTVCLPKHLPTFSRRRKAAPPAAFCGSRATAGLLMPGSSLAGLYFVPYLGIFGAPRHILPEDNLALVGIDVVQVQAVALLRSHQCGGLRVCRNVSRNVADLFLRLGGDEVIQKLVGEILVVAGRGNHQVVDPPGGALGRNLFLDRQAALVQLVRHQRPTHRRDYFVVLEEVGQLPAGGPKLADIGFERD